MSADNAFFGTGTIPFNPRDGDFSLRWIASASPTIRSESPRQPLLRDRRSRQFDGRSAVRQVAHCATVAAFLTDINYELAPERLRGLTPRDIEAFIRRSRERLKRSSLQSVVAHVRTFLRSIASTGEASTGLDRQIDTPRVYREENLPKSLPWETVQAFLQAIDRATPSGIRDYAIFLLIATYGLRACDVVALTLEDVAWRAMRIRIQQRKTGRLLWLPLWNICAEAGRILE